MTQLRIEQSSSTIETVSESVIEKLYDVATEIDEPGSGEDDDAYVSGHISLPNSYRMYVEYLAGSIGEGTSGVVTSLRQNAEGRFQDLRIDVTNGYYAYFEDPNVRTIITNNYGTLTESRFASITNIGTIFSRTSIETFNELSQTGVTTLGDNAFQNCSQLTSIDLSNITQFGNSSLSDCSSLTVSNVNWTNVTKIGGNAFKNVRIQPSDLVLPNVADLAAWPFGNNNNSGITSIDLTGSTFTRLNAGFLEGHSSVDHVTLPATITTIGGWGHFNNTSVRWIKFLSTSIITFENGRNAGQMGIPASTNIYVLDSLINDWKADSNWSSVASQIFPMSQFATDFPNG